MIDDPSRSTVVAWYETLPEDLALLVERVQVGAGRLLGDTFTPRDPTQVHATLIGLESAPAPFDPAPLAAHLREALSPPWTIRFGGFAPGDRRWLQPRVAVARADGRRVRQQGRAHRMARRRW